MKKILCILFTVQFVLAPHITESYSVNSIEDSYEYSIVNQEKKTVKKDILGNTIIEDDNGNKKTIKEDILGNTIIEDNNGNRKTVKKEHCPQFCVNRKLQDSGFILESCFQI